MDTTSSNLVKALGLKERELISLVGAGGKTTVMYTLAQELLSQNFGVITTTTTKIFPPNADQSPALILGGREVFPEIKTVLNQYGQVTWAAERAAKNKLIGVPLADISAFWASGLSDFLIVEADGSAQRPIKAPGDNEPVVPEETTLFISVVGLWALNKPLNETFAFRPERISRLTGIPLNAPMKLETVAQLLVHPQGGMKGWLPQMRAVIILNQADLEPEPEVNRRLAERIKELGKEKISQVIIRGQALNEESPGTL